MPPYNPFTCLFRKIPKAADEAECSLVARKFIVAAHIDGTPRSGSARSQRYGAARSIFQKTLPAAATHVARKSFLHRKILFRAATPPHMWRVPPALEERHS
jgi:hypothetical protein